MDRYGLYNETKSQWEYVIADAVPTVLPNNPADTIRAGSVHIVEVDVKVNDGTPVDVSLANYKALRFEEIDRRTGELISAGYTYATKQFSMSTSAQINISALNQSRDELTYPVNYNTIDDQDTYSVTDATDMHNMYLQALATKKAHLDSGTALKDSIRAATDEAGVDAVVDNR